MCFAVVAVTASFVSLWDVIYRFTFFQINFSLCSDNFFLVLAKRLVFLLPFAGKTYKSGKRRKRRIKRTNPEKVFVCEVDFLMYYIELSHFSDSFTFFELQQYYCFFSVLQSSI